MGRPRDSQRARLYRAEREAFGATFRAFDKVRGSFCCVLPDLSLAYPCNRRAHTGVPQSDGTIRWYHYRTVWAPDAMRTVDELRAFVSAVISHPTWAGPVDIQVGAGQRARTAFASPDPNRVVFPRWARSRPIVLHELAHHAIGWEVAGHGPEFAAAYLDLVGRWIGRDAAKRLRTAFATHKVKVVEA